MPTTFCFFGPFAYNSDAMNGDSHWLNLGHVFGQAKVLPDCMQRKATSQQVVGQGAVYAVSRLAKT